MISWISEMIIMKKYWSEKAYIRTAYYNLSRSRGNCQYPSAYIIIFMMSLIWALLSRLLTSLCHIFAINDD